MHSANKERLPSAEAVTSTTDGETESKPTAGGKPPAALTRQKSVEDLSEEYRAMERFFGITWVSFVEKYHKIILLGFLILFIVAVYGASTLTPQTEEEQFFPEDHYFSTIFNWPSEFYQGLSVSV